MSVAVIPTLLKKGIGGVSVGVNSGSSPPAVPNIFRWRYDENNEVVAMWHPGKALVVYIFFFTDFYISEQGWRRE